MVDHPPIFHSPSLSSYNPLSQAVAKLQKPQGRVCRSIVLQSLVLYLYCIFTLHCTCMSRWSLWKGKCNLLPHKQHVQELFMNKRLTWCHVATCLISLERPLYTSNIGVWDSWEYVNIYSNVQILAWINVTQVDSSLFTAPFPSFSCCCCCSS